MYIYCRYTDSGGDRYSIRDSGWIVSPESGVPL